MNTLYGSQPDGDPNAVIPRQTAGCHLSEGERYAYEATMDGRYPSDDMEYIEE